MQIISKSIEFDAGHRVPTHAGQCRSPHGHRYKVTVRLSGHIVPDQELVAESGMVTDFAFLKDTMMRLVHKPYDHAFIVWDQDLAMLKALMADSTWKVAVVSFIPTAENLAAAILREMVGALAGLPFRVEAVEVHETPTSVAIAS